MVTWQQFEQQAPDLAARVRAQFEATESHLLATLRRDGSPRVSGSEVEFRGTELFIGSMLDAVKAGDLRRDGRFALHAQPRSVTDDGHAKVSGVAVEVSGPDENSSPQGDEEPHHSFRMDVREAVLTTVEGNGLVMRVWHEGSDPVRYERPGNGPVVEVPY
jgi:hypothetical protein